MATRYKTYQYDWGFITIDTQNETAPEGYIAAFDIQDYEAIQIEQGAEIIVESDELIIDSPISKTKAENILEKRVEAKQYAEEHPDQIAIGGTV